jgi:hypothetical protein
LPAKVRKLIVKIQQIAKKYAGEVTYLRILTKKTTVLANHHQHS